MWYPETGNIATPDKIYNCTMLMSKETDKERKISSKKQLYMP